PVEDLVDPFVALVFENSDLVVEILAELVLFSLFDRHAALVLLRAFAREDLHIDDRAVDTRRASERSVAHIAGLLAEDRPQELLFRSQLGLALRSYFAD